MYYKKEAANKETLDKYGKFTPNDWIEKNIYGKHTFLGLTILALVYLALFGWHGIWMYLIQIAWIPFWAAGVINGVAHFKGYRNFVSADESTNISPIGLLIGGEELHNNHHAYPTSAKLSVKWYEFDIGWFWIRIFELLGLAKINKKVELPKVNIQAKELTPTAVQKLLSHKFYVFELFYKKTKKEVDCELKKVKGNDPELKRYSMAKLRSVFYDITENLSAKDQGVLKKLLSSKILNSIYNFKNSLLKIWTDKTKNIQGLKDDLQHWCNEVVNSNYMSLQIFAKTIVKLN